ncbi:MAG: GNAT family N-acetyltransferase [Magnetovibrio sp.]|nr:GNAT family N-acetyltransferase [Magnetovibrio sp.]
MVDFSIRDFVVHDGQSTLDVFQQAVSTLSAQDYSPDQIATWVDSVPDLSRWTHRLITALPCRVAFDDEGVFAFASIDPSGHVDFVMCHPRRARQGISRQLLEEILAIAESAGLEKITTQASLTARPLFEHLGFEVYEQRIVMGLVCFGMNYRINQLK